MITVCLLIFRENIFKIVSLLTRTAYTDECYFQSQKLRQFIAQDSNFIVGFKTQNYVTFKFLTELLDVYYLIKYLRNKQRARRYSCEQTEENFMGITYFHSSVQSFSNTFVLFILNVRLDDVNAAEERCPNRILMRLYIVQPSTSRKMFVSFGFILHSTPVTNLKQYKIVWNIE